uniref:Neuropeptide GPCR B7 n=1 Tax=Nilaparvata lugens TaxID=108931 RepID=U3U908_NILLU|nr:neuropeptide GPCR B7 [Nilaparvata lugens]
MTEANDDDELTIKVKELEAKCHLIQNRIEGVGLTCPPVWDGLLCWPATPAGIVKSLQCPDYFHGFNPTRQATKRCLEDGTWYWSHESNSTWTNYTQCFSKETVANTDFSSHHQILFRYVPIVKFVSQVGYSVSLFTLIIAFCIFATFKGLRCPRNKLHMHLFLSFMLRAFSTLFKDLETNRLERFSATSGELISLREDWASCRAVVTLWQYCLLANYSWILMEGLYLHNLIFLALFSDTSSISLYVALGWGLPLLFVAIWALARIVWENSMCWTTNENALIVMLVKGPTTISVLLNFVLFIKIVRVLLTKLQASVNEQNRRFKRWAKSTLVLMPLFGVHYAIFISMSYVDCGPEIEIIWLFGDQLFASFQGSFVALLYCFMNGEVRAELNKKCLRRWPSNSAANKRRRQSETTGQYSNTCAVRPHHYGKGRDNRKSLGRLETSVTSITTSCPFDPSSRKSLPSNGLHRNHSESTWLTEQSSFVNSKVTAGNGIELMALHEKYEEL